MGRDIPLVGVRQASARAAKRTSWLRCYEESISSSVKYVFKTPIHQKIKHSKSPSITRKQFNRKKNISSIVLLGIIQRKPLVGRQEIPRLWTPQLRSNVSRLFFGWRVSITPRGDAAPFIIGLCGPERYRRNRHVQLAMQFVSARESRVVWLRRVVEMFFVCERRRAFPGSMSSLLEERPWVTSDAVWFGSVRFGSCRR